MGRKHIDRPQRAKGVVHKMIADVAKGCAGEQWETLAKQNRFYALNPDREAFVTKHWPKYLDVARTLLAGMLGSPKYDDATKAQIKDALMRDGAVNPRKMATPEKPRILFSK